MQVLDGVFLLCLLIENAEIEAERLCQCDQTIEKVGLAVPRSMADSMELDTPVRSDSRSSVKPSALRAIFTCLPISGADSAIIVELGSN